MKLVKKNWNWSDYCVGSCANINNSIIMIFLNILISNSKYKNWYHIALLASLEKIKSWQKVKLNLIGLLCVCKEVMKFNLK